MGRERLHGEGPTSQLQMGCSRSDHHTISKFERPGSPPYRALERLLGEGPFWSKDTSLYCWACQLSTSDARLAQGMGQPLAQSMTPLKTNSTPNFAATCLLTFDGVLYSYKQNLTFSGERDFKLGCPLTPVCLGINTLHTWERNPRPSRTNCNATPPS